MHVKCHTHNTQYVTFKDNSGRHPTLISRLPMQTHRQAYAHRRIYTRTCAHTNTHMRTHKHKQESMHHFCLVGLVFLSVQHKQARVIWEEEPQRENASTGLTCRLVCRAFSRLLNDRGGPAHCGQVVLNGRVSHEEQASKKDSSMASVSVPAPKSCDKP